MAKKNVESETEGGMVSSSAAASTASATVPVVGEAAAEGSKLASFTEDLGRLLGSAESKARSWLDERAAIADQLTKVRDAASELLKQLGASSGENPFPWIRGRKPGRPTSKRGPGRPRSAAPAVAKRGPGRPKGTGKKKRTMSEETKAKMRAAANARWAARRAQSGANS